MAAVFTRPSVASKWAPDALAGPYSWLTLREWHVAVALSPVSDFLAWLLVDWLSGPADLSHWPWPPTFSRFRSSFLPGALRQKTYEELRDLLRDELAALRQTLEIPPEALNGLLRNSLLAAHGRRLRQLEEQMGTVSMALAAALLLIE